MTTYALPYWACPSCGFTNGNAHAHCRRCGHYAPGADDLPACDPDDARADALDQAADQRYKLQRDNDP